MTAPNRPRRASTVHHGAAPSWTGHASEPGGEAAVTALLDAANGATHMSVSVVELPPGGIINGHLHPFEESFFILEGESVLNIDGTAYRLRPQDFGIIPTARGHAWSNPGDSPAKWLRIQAPQPRDISGRSPWGAYEATGVVPQTDGLEVDEVDPRNHYIGRFSETDMAPPGPISMPGYHGANVRNVQIRMMVDDLIGAVQHTMFIVQFTGTGAGATASAKEHFHPFEEAFYILSGSVILSSDGEREVASSGDLVFAPTGASHGFAPVGTDPVRWVEIQSPAPPIAHGFTFHADWEKLTPLG